MTLTWFRGTNTSANLTGTWWIAAIPAGATLMRVRWSWGYTITTDPLVDATGNTQFNSVVLGLCTTIGNGTEAVPNPRSTPGDVAPPTQRWLWWEARAPVMTAYSAEAGVIGWRDSGNQEDVDVRAQVLATGIPGGDTLNLWASWASGYGRESDASWCVWGGASVLYKH